MALVTAYYTDPAKDKEIDALAKSAGVKGRGYVITPRFRSFQMEVDDSKVLGFVGSLKVKGFETERPRG